MSSSSILGVLVLATVALACTKATPAHPAEVTVITPANDANAASAPPVSAARSDGVPAVPTPLLASGDTDPAPPPAAPAPAVVPQGDACGLRATLRELPPRDGFARYTLRLTNAGKTPVRLVIPGDGSEAGWRTPALTWIATANGKPAAPEAGGRCGMMNAIEDSEIFTLAPGASRDISEWLGSPSFAPGTYDLRLRYRNDPALQTGKAPVAPDVAQKIAQTQACDVTSNSIKTTLKRP